MNERLDLIYKSNNISGILIKEDDLTLTIKLESGYNAILNKNDIEKIKKREIIKLNSTLNLEFQNKKNKDLLNIKLLHTGGTIASKVDYKTGAVSSKFTPEEILSLFPQLTEKVNIDVELVGNLFSEDLRFSHYNLLLKKIEKSLNYDAIIISHGTDTIHYSSVALQYAIKNLNIPIILVGAQRSSDRPSSDAYSNLSAAIDFIIYNSTQEKKFLRVGVCMHETISDDSFLIFDSINLKKMHSTRRDAFKQINYLPFARIKNSKFEILREELLSSNSLNSKRQLKINYYDENLKIGFFKVHPNLFPEEINNLKFYDAVIIEGTGLGHISVNKINDFEKTQLDIFNSLKELSNLIPIIIATQTVSGEVNLNVYSTGRRLQELNILFNKVNLISETLFIRIAFCLSNKNLNWKKLWDENLENFELKRKYIS